MAISDSGASRRAAGVHRKTTPVDRHSRRSVLRCIAAAGATGLAATSPLGAPFVHGQAVRKITIGYVHSTPTAMVDRYIIDKVLAATRQQVRPETGGRFQLVIRTPAPSPSTLQEKVEALIIRQGCDMILGMASNPLHTAVIAAECERQAIPCLTTLATIGEHAQHWHARSEYLPRYSFHFSYLLSDVMRACFAMYRQLATHGRVGFVASRDQQGDSWARQRALTDPRWWENEGRWTLAHVARPAASAVDYQPVIASLRAAGADFLATTMPPEAFRRFWRQCQDYGFRPQALTVARIEEDSASLRVLAGLQDNLATTLGWSPHFLTQSSLSQETSASIAAGFMERYGVGWWPQSLGYAHALFEIAVDALQRSADPLDPEKVALAIAATDRSTVLGHIRFDGAGLQDDPIDNTQLRQLCRTLMLGAQWHDGLSWAITSNRQAPWIPAHHRMRSLR
ncbi:MAG: ABC transporter substrate-binding protein [Alphaproteobacteria bacterium]|nr:ABC transporter substrate-binding protein [Alphaproteobacteria bacterium]